MKKVFRIENLDCALCATKLEEAIAKIDGVEKANVSFLTKKIKITADDSKIDSVIDELKRVCRRVEPDCEIIL